MSIGVGVPVHNGENFLGDCLASIAAQDLDHLDVLISDNASTDGTEEICRDRVAADSRFRYVRQSENLGAAGNYNFVMHNSRGELYKMAAHDDLLGPGFVSRCIEALEAHPEAVLAFPRTRYIDEHGATIGDYERPLIWTHACTPSGRLRDLFVSEHSSLLHLCYPIMGVMRRSAALRTRGIQAFQAADAAMLVELALIGDFVEVPEPLYLKRLHDNTSMRANATPEEFAKWYDPINARSEPMPVSRLARSHFTAPARCGLAVNDLVTTTAQTIRWFFAERRFRIVASELRGAARRRHQRAMDTTPS